MDLWSSEPRPDKGEVIDQGVPDAPFAWFFHASFA